MGIASMWVWLPSWPAQVHKFTSGPVEPPLAGQADFTGERQADLQFPPIGRSYQFDLM